MARCLKQGLRRLSEWVSKQSFLRRLTLYYRRQAVAQTMHRWRKRVACVCRPAKRDTRVARLCYQRTLLRLCLREYWFKRFVCDRQRVFGRFSGHHRAVVESMRGHRRLFLAMVSNNWKSNVAILIKITIFVAIFAMPYHYSYRSLILLL